MERENQVQSPMTAATGGSVDVPKNLDEWKNESDLNEAEKEEAERFGSGHGIGYVMPESFDFWLDIPDNKSHISQKYRSDACWTECDKKGNRPDFSWYRWMDVDMETIFGPSCPYSYKGDSCFLDAVRCVRCCTGLYPWRNGENYVQGRFIDSYPGGMEKIQDMMRVQRHRNYLQMYIWKGKNAGMDRVQFLAWYIAQRQAAMKVVQARIKKEKEADLAWVNKNFGNVAGFRVAHALAGSSKPRSPNHWFS